MLTNIDQIVSGYIKYRRTPSPHTIIQEHPTVCLAEAIIIAQRCAKCVPIFRRRKDYAKFTDKRKSCLKRAWNHVVKWFGF